jgi:ectoine hydroxylase-related dioxygenase (phytanoyl-CoA dioxygenase family)
VIKVADSLTSDQVAAYHRDGILFPIRVMSEAEAAAALQRLEALEAREGGKLSDRTNEKTHILVPWLSDLVRHPKILDAVESLLGASILCWSSGFFTKSPNDGNYISWHQDSTYWQLSSSDVLTVWLALTPSVPENGCLQVIPGSHMQQVPHRDTFADGNQLSRGQEIAVPVDRSQAIDVVLQPGEMSLHHTRIFHASEPNRSTFRRVGFSIRYVPTHVRQMNGRTTALLVRGIDAYHHFEPEPIPQTEFDAAAIDFHTHALKLLMPVVYAGTDKVDRALT